MIGSSFPACFRRWLFLANLLVGVFLGLPFSAPLFVSVGGYGLADFIYDAYQLSCHELPYRAYFLFGPQATYSLAELQTLGVSASADFRGSPELGYKVAFCARNVALYAGVLIAGLVYARWRERCRPLALRWFVASAAPLALDGVTQLVGWRESTWELRTITGLAFGVAAVWLLYPRLEVLLSVQRPLRPPGARIAAGTLYKPLR